MSKCVLCGSKAVINRQDNASRTIYNCDLCGVFVVSDLVLADLEAHTLEVAAFMMSRKLEHSSELVLLSYNKAIKDKDYLQLTVEQIVSRFPKNFTELTDYVLYNLARMSAFAGDEIKVDTLEMASLFYVRHQSYDALSYIIRFMQKAALIEVNYYGASFFPCGIVLTPKGWDRLSRFEEGKSTRNGMFAALAKQGNAWSEPFCKAVKDAAKHSGYELAEGCLHNNASDTVNYEMIASIKRSSFVVCDITVESGGVYYALGLAQSLGKVTALTCHVSAGKELKVDTNQLNVIFWDTQKELYSALFNMIRAFLP